MKKKILNKKHIKITFQCNFNVSILFKQFLTLRE